MVRGLLDSAGNRWIDFFLVLFPHLKVFVFVNHLEHDFGEVGIELGAHAFLDFASGGFLAEKVAVASV